MGIPNKLYNSLFHMLDPNVTQHDRNTKFVCLPAVSNTIVCVCVCTQLGESHCLSVIPALHCCHIILPINNNHRRVYFRNMGNEYALLQPKGTFINKHL